MGRRIEFINPFGTEVYDGLIAETLLPCTGAETEVTIRHLRNAPRDIDYYYNKHLMETLVFERVMQAEEEGFDAVIVGCCYDPGVRVARAGGHPRDRSARGRHADGQLFAHSYTIVTDHHKAAP